MIRNSPPRQSGFTVIELMITVTILAVLAAVAIPSFGNMIQNSRRTATVNELIANLMLARSEAAKSGQAVVICGVDTGNNNILDASELGCSETDWRDGWIVAIWVDANNDTVVDASELQLPPMRIFINDHGGLTVTATAAAMRLRPFNQAGTAGNITVCDKRGAAHARRVCLSNNGRARVSEKDCNGTDAITCP